MSIVPHKSPLLWSGGVAARETLSYLDRRGIDAEPALSGAGSRPAKVSPITRAAGNDSDQTDKGHAALYTMSVIAKHHGRMVSAASTMNCTKMCSSRPQRTFVIGLKRPERRWQGLT